MRSREDNAIFTNIPIEDIKFYEQANDELEKENKQLKERIVKYEEACKELESYVDYQLRENINMDQRLVFSLLKTIYLKKFEELEKGDSNESNRFIK